MAILNQAQLLTASNATYIDNTVGAITPTSVRSLNTNWIESSILVSQTSSLSVATASLALTALATPNAIVTASVAASTLTFTKGDGSQFNLVVSQSGSIESASFAQNAATASFANNANLLDNLDSTAFVLTSSYNNVVNPLTASFNALTASYNATSASYVVTSASYAAASASLSTRVNTIETKYANTGSNTFTGTNIFNVVTASYVYALSASIDYLSVIYQTSSVIYSSGSNVFGDNANDSQTLWGTVNVVTGPLHATGSVNVTGSIVMSGNSPVVATKIKATDIQGVDILTNTGTQVATFGAGGGTGVTIVGNVNAAAFAGSGSGIIGVVTASFAQTASFVRNAVSASFAATASSVNTLNQVLTIEGTGTSLILTGSNQASTRFSPSLNIVDTLNAPGVNADGQIFASDTATAGQYIGAIKSDYSVDVEHAIVVSTSSITLNDWNNNTAAYVPYLTIAPNVGDDPAPQFQRGLGITGSVNGNVVSASISSNTSSLDFSTANFFTSLVGSNTFFNITNPKAGETVNLLLTTSGAATASFSSNVKQVSGSAYQPTAGSGKVDVLSFISFDGTSVYLANIKNMI